MHDQALIWNTDTNLQVTSLTARLRNLAGIGGTSARLSVSDLWGSDEPLGIAVVAHHWALDGESLRFEATVDATPYQFELEPLHAASGAIVGVFGRALPLAEIATPSRDDVAAAAERFAGVGTWSEDLRTGATTISPGLAALLGISSDATTLALRSFDHPDERDATGRYIAQMLSEDDAYTHDHRILCPDGRIRYVRERARTLYDERGMAYAQIGTLNDITEFKQREAELAELAHYDALTRLPNRALLEERLAASLARCERHNVRCAVLFIDLDDFKRVNDTHGHAAGDRMINRVGEHLTRYVRASDTVARLGGDEFVVLLEDLLSDEAAVDAARKILRSFDQPFGIHGQDISIGASIGIAIYPGGAHTPHDLIDRADREMYAVKRNGGSGIKLAPMAAREEPPCVSAENTSCAARSSSARHRFVTHANA